MENFAVSTETTTILQAMSKEELDDFTHQHNRPATEGDKGIETAIYAFLLMYTKFGSQSHRRIAIELATDWLDATNGDNPDMERRKSLQKTVETSVQGIQDVAWEGEYWARRLNATYEQNKDLPTLQLGLRYALQSVAYTLHLHPDRGSRLSLLASLYEKRCREHTEQNPGDLDWAILYMNMATKEAPSDDASMWRWLSLLSSWLQQRWKDERANKDLDAAIEAAEKALSRSPVERKKYCRAALTSRLNERYSLKGNIEDLNRAIELAEQAAAASIADTDPKKALHRINLAAWLGMRFERQGSTADIDRAVQMAEEALEITPTASEQRANTLSVLGTSRRLRFSKTRSDKDLEEPVTLSEQAVGMTDPHNPELPHRSVHLGMCYMRRYEVKNNSTDLNLAITKIEEAVKHPSPEGHEQASWLTALSLCYSYSFKAEVKKNKKNIDKAIERAEEALSVISKTHRDRIAALSGLALRLRERYDVYYEDEDIERAICLWKTAWGCTDGLPILRIQSAGEAAKGLAILKKWVEADHLLQQAVSLLAKVNPKVLQPNDLQDVVAKVPGLASMAAAVALQAGRKVEAALNLLETGRGVVAGLAMDSRAELTMLKQAHPDLAKEYLDIRRRMIVLPSVLKNVLITNQSSEDTSESFFKDARDAESEFNMLLKRIRLCKGFKKFGLPPTIEDMVQAGDEGPVVTINLSPYRCDAFIIFKGQIMVLPLPKLNLDDLKAKLRSSGLWPSRQSLNFENLYSTMEWLWDVATGPILNEIGYREPASSGDPPRVWWIPTGILTRFPLHAAGYHRNNSKDTVLDRAMSSYASSVRSLVFKRNSSNRSMSATGNSRHRHAVLVSMIETPGQSPLPLAAEEVKTVRRLLQSMKFHTKSPKPQKYRVVQQIQRCDIFHFAGHGKISPFHPTNSSFLLEDWQTNPLTVDNLLDEWIEGSDSASLKVPDCESDPMADEESLERETGGCSTSAPSPFLAYLSACSSGSSDVDELSDEQIHLASALQLAGFQHVIASLWDVSDKSCVDVARTVYESLAREGMTDRAVCHALHQAIKCLRDKCIRDVQESNASIANRASVETTEYASLPSNSKSASLGHLAEPPSNETPSIRNVVPFHSKNRDSRGYLEPRWIPFVHFGT